MLIFYGYVMDTFWIRNRVLDTFWIRFGYVLDTRPASRDIFGYAPNRANLGYAGSKVREGCTKRNFGYVMDTRTPLQHIQKFWIRILGGPGPGMPMGPGPGRLFCGS